MTRHPDPDDLRDLLDSSFGDGPPTTPPADRLGPARRALRRRRWASGGLTLGAVAAAVTVAAMLSGPGDGPRAVGPASDGGATTATPAPVPTPVAGGGDECSTGDEALPPGAVPSPVGGSTPPDPVAGTSLSCAEESEAVPATTRDGESTVVRFARPGTERLVARGGATLVAQSADVELPDNFAGPRDRTAVALVTVGDERTFVLARQIEGSRPEYIPFRDDRGRYPTIAAFLDFAQGKYAGGEGLR